MSDTVWVALITGGVGLAGLALNLHGQAQDRKQRARDRADDKAEWRQREVYGRRLDSIQEAYKWAISLHRYGSVARMHPSDDAFEKRKASCMDARDWYDANSVFLYDSLPQASEFVGLINTAAEVGRGDGDQNQLETQFDLCTQQLRDRLQSLMNEMKTS